MKFFTWIKENILFITTLFLLALIPLYPKRPLIDIQHTWVYIRVEDFIVALSLSIWVFLLLRKKITLKTPLTFPIILFWIIGGIATLHGVLLIFPTLSEVFSNVAFLSYLRRIEYISVFFIAFASIRDKKNIFTVIAVMVFVLLCIVGYGFGQKFLGFPAFLTMNEEFAKGVPIQLSQLSRIPSTFAGHYDLAAYLVLVIPLFVSLVFGFKNWLIKIFLLVTAALGFALLFTTVSRVSFVVLLFSLVFLLILQGKRIVLISLFLLTLVLLVFSPSLLQRFGNTVSEVDVLVDAKTGAAMGHIKEVPSAYFKDKVVLRYFTPAEQSRLASISAIFPISLIPPQAILLTESNTPTGENLPQGTGYVNLPLSPVVKKINQYFYEKTREDSATDSAKVLVYYGDFLIKRAIAYDLSFTTRFQGEWPRTFDAFMKNIFIGSGYGSVSLAVDNNYLRILGESGLFGLISFISIFIVAGIYIKKILPHIDSRVIRSFVFGFIAGTFGLALNAVLIDVFEASKIAFTYWLLMGVTLGTLHLYKKDEINIFTEVKKVVSSSYAVVFYLLVITVAFFSTGYSYYFVGDDFTWLRSISNCSYDGAKEGMQQCQSLTGTFINYFTHPNGVFYRPGMSMYLFFMYAVFWLNQTMYHFVSIFLHFAISVVLFFIAKKILKDNLIAAMSACIFLILSGKSEAVFWISSVGILFTTFFGLLSLLLFIFWVQKEKIVYFILSLISIGMGLLFHELGITVPLLLMLYDSIFVEKQITQKITKKVYYLFLLLPIVPYFLMRFLAHTFLLPGDYPYNPIAFFFNSISNLIGYFLLTLFGTGILSFYQQLQDSLRAQIIFGVLFSFVSVSLGIIIYRMIIKNMVKDEQRIIIFGFLFFIISLLPFLGLNHISSGYSYLASVSFAMLFIFYMKKIYRYLIRTNDRYVTLSCIAIIAIIFSMMHLFQLQKIHVDWLSAGEKSEKFLISVNEHYSNEWTKKHMEFYFINTPIRSGEAWVFPAGLHDAIWFVFKNQNIDIFQSPSVEEALILVGDSLDKKVFEFNDNGSFIERKTLK